VDGELSSPDRKATRGGGEAHPCPVRKSDGSTSAARERHRHREPKPGRRERRGRRETGPPRRIDTRVPPQDVRDLWSPLYFGLRPRLEWCPETYARVPRRSGVHRIHGTAVVMRHFRGPASPRPHSDRRRKRTKRGNVWRPINRGSRPNLAARIVRIIGSPPLRGLGRLSGIARGQRVRPPFHPPSHPPGAASHSDVLDWSKNFNTIGFKQFFGYQKKNHGSPNDHLGTITEASLSQIKNHLFGWLFLPVLGPSRGTNSRFVRERETRGGR